MTTVTYTPSHPIIFIFDFLNENMEVPEYDPLEVVAANNSCLSIRTIADVDGDVTVELLQAFPNDHSNMGEEVFQGAIHAPNRKIAVVTSLNEKLLEADVSDTKVNIHIFVDEKENPSRVQIVIPTIQ